MFWRWSNDRTVIRGMLVIDRVRVLGKYSEEFEVGRMGESSQNFLVTL